MKIERHHPSFSDGARCICGLPMKDHPPRVLPPGDPDYGQPWHSEQRVKGGNWLIRNSVGRVVCDGICTHGQAEFIVSKVNG